MNQTAALQVVSVYELKGAHPPAQATYRGPTWWAEVGNASREDPIGRSELEPSWFHSAPTLLVTDVDSTLIEEEVIDQLAALAGCGEEVAELTERAMSGQMSFADSLRARVAPLEGLGVGAFAEVFSELTIRPGAKELVDWIHAGGGRVAAISGGFTPVVKMIAMHLNIDFVCAIDLEEVDGKLTGRVAGEIVTEETKRTFVTELAEKTGLRSVALGDGANDLLMLSAADLGIGINAKPVVRAQIPNYLNGTRLDPVIGLLGHEQLVSPPGSCATL